MTEATMYYPYGTMEAFLKPPTDDNVREKFTGKELDAGENPASEVSFNIAINNFDAGMHYHGELYVNYTDLVYNRSFLKVYPLQYDTDADKFILNTADRFLDSMRVTNLRIATSGAVSPINYEKACDYTVITDSGLVKVIALDTSGSALINSSSVNYFTDSTYTPERVAGSNLYYFGARYYDAELGVWGSTDPKLQYWNPYKYSANPNMFIDPDGSLFFIANLIKSIQVWKNSGSFSDGLMNFTWNMLVGMNGTDPITVGTTFGGIEMVTNIVSNYEGWANGNSGDYAFWQGAGKFILSGISGWTTGQISGLNASTAGIFNEPLGALSAGVTSINHDVNFGSGGDYYATKDVLQKLYSYGSSGSIIKLGGDVTWANHAVNEGPFVYDNWYDESKNRYRIMSAKINGRKVGGKDFGYYGTGNNNSHKYNRFGHRALGVLLPSKPWYYGFEAWGEPYERWVIDDYDDDHWHYTSGSNPFGDSNAQEEGVIDFGSGWENAW